jgi:hypothetical protein
MKQPMRIKQLFKIPSYRLRLGFFLAIGFSLVLLSIYALKDPPWQNLVLSIATAFIGVGLVNYLWDFLGGDLLEIKIDAVQRTTQVLSDMNDENIGIERIWLSRREWADDPHDGPKKWRERLCQAHTVSIVSNTFWKWFDDKNFAKDFFKHIASGGAKVKLLVYDPQSDILKTRAKDEKEIQIDSEFQMQNEIYCTLGTISKGLTDLTPNARRNFEIRLTDKSYHLAQILKADDHILVSTYLSGESGSPCPTYQIKEPSGYFSTYDKQIETLWNNGRSITLDEMKEMLYLSQIIKTKTRV